MSPRTFATSHTGNGGGVESFEMLGSADLHWDFRQSIDQALQIVGAERVFRANGVVRPERRY